MDFFLTEPLRFAYCSFSMLLNISCTLLKCFNQNFVILSPSATFFVLFFQLIRLYTIVQAFLVLANLARGTLRSPNFTEFFNLTYWRCFNEFYFSFPLLPDKNRFEMEQI